MPLRLPCKGSYIVCFERGANRLPSFFSSSGITHTLRAVQFPYVEMQSFTHPPQSLVLYDGTRSQSREVARGSKS